MENKALNNRLIIISIFVFLFFSALTLKLVNVQIINKDKYKKSLDDIKVDEVYSTSTPRGRIFDRNYNLLVDNVGVKTIYYKRKPETSTKTQIELAYKMADKIDLDYSKLAKTNLKEFYLVNNKDKVNKKITEKERELLKQRKITISDINNMTSLPIENGIMLIDNAPLNNGRTDYRLDDIVVNRGVLGYPQGRDFYFETSDNLKKNRDFEEALVQGLKKKGYDIK